MQFPWSFRNTPENREYVTRVRERFREYLLVLEVRHASWNQSAIIELLEELELGLCKIDQPLFHRSIKPGTAATSSTGYIRLHGRNYRNWFTENKHVGERYDYLYSVEELEPWIDRIKAVDAATQDTYVVTNNHFVGKAVVNALEITSILRGELVAAPPPVVDHYPELRGFVI